MWCPVGCETDPPLWCASGVAPEGPLGEFDSTFHPPRVSKRDNFMRCRAGCHHTRTSHSRGLRVCPDPVWFRPGPPGYFDTNISESFPASNVESRVIQGTAFGRTCLAQEE